MLANYDHAKSIHEERLRAAERARLVSQLRTARRATRGVGGPERRGDWSLVWPSSDVTGKAVTVINTGTGEKHTGRDPSDWDRAVGHAVRQLGVGV